MPKLDIPMRWHHHSRCLRFTATGVSSRTQLIVDLNPLLIRKQGALWKVSGFVSSPLFEISWSSFPFYFASHNALALVDGDSTARLDLAASMVEANYCATQVTLAGP
jgi:hypothetical protein